MKIIKGTAFSVVHANKCPLKKENCMGCYYLHSWEGSSKYKGNQNCVTVKCLQGEKKMKCVCCGKKKATIKDYREEYGTTGSYPVCKDCFRLSDRTFFKKVNAPRKDKK